MVVPSGRLGHPGRPTQVAGFAQLSEPFCESSETLATVCTAAAHYGSCVQPKTAKERAFVCKWDAKDLHITHKHRKRGPTLKHLHGGKNANCSRIPQETTLKHLHGGKNAISCRITHLQINGLAIFSV